MREILLGLRLLLGSGRGNRVRFVLMAAGSAVGVACLAMVLAIPGILAAQDGRKAAREADCPRNDRRICIGAGKAPLELDLTDPYGSRPMTRVFHAPGATTIDPPPGLKELPAPGDLFVSPELHEQLRRSQVSLNSCRGGYVDSSALRGWPIPTSCSRISALGETSWRAARL